MPVNTISVGAAVTPTVIQTYLSHYLNRRPLAQKPTAHISYHEGLELIRRFLHYASLHTVDELQAFTSQWVPVPRWVHVNVVEVSSSLLQNSAQHISAQLGPEGVKAVGGDSWWQWRREGTTLKAEWIEMRKDYEARKQLAIPRGDRIMFVDEHRYQMQRHARKLKARVLAPKYRLAPQFPFPCGLHDCLAAYLYLLEEKHDPTTIILAGDSAGGGMVLSMLVTMRDQGIPLPAGAILISPWVDLTHSFPSLGGDSKMDYIPPHGFVHKPSMSWPPPNADDMLEIETTSKGTSQKQNTLEKDLDHASKKEAKAERVRGYSVHSTDGPTLDDTSNPTGTGQGADVWISSNGKYSVGPKSQLSVQLEDVRIEIKDQIQMYAPNHLLTHPLVSPVLQPTLGGLPPLLIQTGGGELLRDEQIYIAHKAAQPLVYIPPPSNNQTAEAIQAQVTSYKPTNVQLQVWDDLCHVCPTLSFTRPAKHMYRSIAQFGAWALARAQKKSIEILDDDDISFMSSGSSSSSDSDKAGSNSSSDDPKSSASHPLPQDAQTLGKKGHLDTRVGRAGDPIPPFERHMIRQRIDRHGRIYPLATKEDLPALNIPSVDVGVPKKGPVSKWMKAQTQWNNKFSKQKIRIQKQRIKDMQKGFEGFEGESPPPTALAGRRVKGMKAEKAKKKSWGMAMWSGWGSSHDQATIVREEKADQTTEEPSTSVQNPEQPNTDGAAESKSKRSRSVGLSMPNIGRSRSRSRHSAVTDKGQTGVPMDDLPNMELPTPGLADATTLAPERSASPLPSPVSDHESAGLPSNIILSDNPTLPSTIIPDTDTLTTRPTAGGIAYPFRLKVDGPDGKDVNASTLTLASVNITTPPAVEASPHEKELGSMMPVTESVNEQVLNEERPGIERFVTAGQGAGLFSDGIPAGHMSEETRGERPPIERFETAQDDLSTLGAGNTKL
ncbi:alpha beta-hydrolase [Stemphylium lycopersici]|uniref:Alpha beta-hydrolase n=1 Tax=Stemphylium lycopersici TaxID=183478 RepID=A0A364MSS8_STELY|nr:alpha beta-hydrolase [Stemphylium lycopersici]